MDLSFGFVTTLIPICVLNAKNTMVSALWLGPFSLIQEMLISPFLILWDFIIHLEYIKVNTFLQDIIFTYLFQFHNHLYIFISVSQPAINISLTDTIVIM